VQKQVDTSPTKKPKPTQALPTTQKEEDKTVQITLNKLCRCLIVICNHLTDIKQKIIK
jgi:hypothetical protein